jgi:DNA-binding transcriptional LysR family regulator
VLDWNDLRFAHAVARTGSLTKAGRQLGVHQTTVGRRLAALEQALGCPLFTRSAGGLTPTSEGTRVLASIEPLASALLRFERRAPATTTEVRGLVRVAVTETGARQLVEGALPALMARHPELELELVPSNLVADLARGEADLAVRLVRPDGDVVARRLGQVTYGLYASDAYLADHPAPFADALAGHDIVVPVRELAHGPEAAWLARHATAARPRLRANSLVTLAQAVAAGLGVCALPNNLAAMHAGARLVRRLPEIPGRPVWLVTHRELRKVARVRVVAAAIVEEMKRRLA